MASIRRWRSTELPAALTASWRNSNEKWLVASS
jgi:hypothetical protein